MKKFDPKTSAVMYALLGAAYVVSGAVHELTANLLGMKSDVILFDEDYHGPELE